jgi:hypothetical protein
LPSSQIDNALLRADTISSQFWKSSLRSWGVYSGRFRLGQCGAEITLLKSLFRLGHVRAMGIALSQAVIVKLTFASVPPTIRLSKTKERREA